MTGYTRNDVSNNIANGNVIDADDLDGEFNAVQAAFHESTGHTHDGTSASGAPITVIGPNQEFVASATAYTPKTTNFYDLGSNELQWKDIYISGSIQGDLTGNITGNATTASSLETARAITLSGDATGTADFDGSTGVTITVTVVDDSHNHVISNVDGLQTALDGKASLAGSGSQAFTASTLNATTVDLGDWTITESAGVLYFATGGVNKMELDASGNLVVVGNITAYGTI
jgi:hypothetical protein